MGLTTQTYDILSRIAIGNGALIYRAVDKATTRQVALKLLVQEGNLDHRLDVDALLADAPRLRQMSGAHICQLLDAYPDDDGPVLVYEFADGRNGQVQGEKRTLAPAEALDVAAQLISALRSGERQKCPHGDVKPSNIMLADLPDGRPFLVVLDWGIAAHRSAMPDESLPFLAPERLAGSPVSHAGDLFSAGAVLFFLLTGKTLVGGQSPEALLAMWRRAQPAVLAELRPDLPAKFVQWVCRLLEPDPKKRPASAVDAGAALAAMGPPPPSAPAESVPAAAKSDVNARVKGLHPAVKAAITSTISALVCVGGWFAFFHDRDPGVGAAKAPENAGAPAPVREAAASVGPPIGLASDRAVAAEREAARAKAAAAKAKAVVKKKPQPAESPVTAKPEAAALTAPN